MKKQGKLLIVDDEEIALRNLGRVMEKEGYEVTTSQSGVHALSLIKSHGFDLMLTDLRMEKVDGMQLLRACRAAHPDTEVIMITGYATTESAVEAMKEGAFYYIAKPFRLDEVRKVVSEAMEKVHLRRENRQLREQVETYRGKVKIITQNSAMKKLLTLASQVAPTDCSVLITGDSGTGKELIARYLHLNSTRCDAPFIAVNCGAFSEDLLANELFGHEKEAFTGAVTQKKGLIETASGGTLFLDEITELSTTMQVKLLRVIQEGEVLRLGATEPVKVNNRVIAATNRDINGMVKNGTFRQDLYFRLNVVTLHIPPLAERKDDIPLLMHHFLQRYSAQMRKNVTGIANDVVGVLTNHDFPGNVRELENIIERGVALCNGDTVEMAQLSDELRETIRPVFRKKDGEMPTLEDHEMAYIRWVLDELDGNQSLAAQTLGINRSSLWRKLKTSRTDGK